MGLLEELFQLIQEASSEAQPRPRPLAPAPTPLRQTGPTPSSPMNAQATDVQEIRRRLLVQQQREAARLQQLKPQAKPAPADKPAAVSKAPAAVDAGKARKATVVVPTIEPISRATRLAHALRQHRTFADLIVMKELFDKPLCLRGRMRRR